MRTLHDSIRERTPQGMKQDIKKTTPNYDYLVELEPTAAQEAGFSQCAARILGFVPDHRPDDDECSVVHDLESFDLDLTRQIEEQSCPSADDVRPDLQTFRPGDLTESDTRKLIPLFTYANEKNCNVCLIGGRLVALCPRPDSGKPIIVLKRSRSVSLRNILSRALTTTAGAEVRSSLLDLAEWLVENYYVRSSERAQLQKALQASRK